MQWVQTFLVAAVLVVGCGTGPGSDGDDDTGAGSTTGAATTADDDGDPTGSPGTTASTSTSATSADTGETTSSVTTDDGTTGGPFELEVHTELTDDGRLSLRCNLPADVEACTALAGAPCDDVDLDGLVDAWEDIVLDRLRPLQRLDEAEPLVEDADAVLGNVGRVAPAGERIRAFIMLGYHYDYGSCGFTAHNGDSERVALDLERWPDLGPGGVIAIGAYTAAHEGAATDNGRVFTGEDLGELFFTADADHGEPRWVVFPSRAKHATYASVEICEGISAVPCLDEDCGPDGVDDPATYDRLPTIVNAGEEAAPRVTDLTELGFPGDDAWAMQDFCGGLGGTGCSSPVREKLLVDPFGG